MITYSENWARVESLIHDVRELRNWADIDVGIKEECDKFIGYLWRESKRLNGNKNL